jgi:uncharacterized membrane protein|tara:strand:+ start:375 stop:590 length:216 start_codon:yes stop_codon:yes gene_type:complete
MIRIPRNVIENLKRGTLLIMVLYAIRGIAVVLLGIFAADRMDSDLRVYLIIIPIISLVFIYFKYRKKIGKD